MVLQSLSGLPAFLIYLVCASVLVAAYLYVYTWITAHNEFELLRANNSGAAISLSLSTIGFALPLTSSIAHADGILDMTIWGVIALIVQVGVYYLARIGAIERQRGNIAALVEREADRLPFRHG